MGLFEDLGRKVGEFTHEAKRAAEEGANYACADCGERFHAARETCPECGSERVVERGTASTDDDSTGSADSVETDETDDDATAAESNSE